ncbi:MAG: hypothetical protein ACRDDZ_03580 [Marinifilaceae bacterium]
MTQKILNIVAIAMFAITAVILGMFIWGGEIPNSQFYTPVHTATLLNWAIALCGIAVCAAMVFPLVRLFSRPKEAVKSFIGLAVLVGVVGIAYTLADGTPMNIVGYNGTDNVPSTLIFSDTVLFTMYLLFFGTIAAIIGTELFRKVR